MARVLRLLAGVGAVSVAHLKSEIVKSSGMNCHPHLPVPHFCHPKQKPCIHRVLTLHSTVLTSAQARTCCLDVGVYLLTRCLLFCGSFHLHDVFDIYSNSAVYQNLIPFHQNSKIRGIDVHG